MQVVPVIDLMRGQVVRGVAGRRDQYRPIESILCDDARPLSVAAAFVKLGFPHAYLADLDAIQSKGVGSPDSRPPSWSIYEDLMRAGLDLWIDAGLHDAEQARELAQFQVDGRPISGIVAGLESLADPQALSEICAAVGPARLIFSLDLKHGVPLVGSPAWHGLSPEQIAAVALRAGVRQMIVLDLAGVGMSTGVSTIPLCRALHCLAPNLQIIAGGGVRGPADLDSLSRAGCGAALVASALHDGRLSAAECVERPTRTEFQFSPSQVDGDEGQGSPRHRMGNESEQTTARTQSNCQMAATQRGPIVAVKARKFFMLSCLLAIAAIACQLTWLGSCSRSLMLRAHSVTLTENERAAAIAEADHILSAAYFYPYFGLGAAVPALLFGIIAVHQREPAPTDLPIVLLVLYVVTLFILV